MYALKTCIFIELLFEIFHTYPTVGYSVTYPMYLLTCQSIIWWLLCILVIFQVVD